MRERAILLLEKTHFGSAFYESIGEGSDHLVSKSFASSEGKSSEPNAKVRKIESSSLFSKLESVGQNDIYTWLLGWRNSEVADDQADFKINMIRPVDEKVSEKKEAVEVEAMH